MFIVTFIIILVLFIGISEYLHHNRVKNIPPQGQYPGYDNRQLDGWDIVVGSIAAFCVALSIYILFFLREWWGYMMYFGLAVILVLWFAYHHQRSSQVHRPRQHGEVTIVMYNDEFTYGVLDAWWVLEDQSIVMRLLPCDVVGNLENTDPVLVPNTAVKGHWAK